ncbi:MAG: hypothetical protein GY869_15290, partial [Planctomycetes bacterium]|nr:hypothetical protein [Planctomycetota bacterium]
MSEWVNGKFMLASPEINAAPATKFNPPQGAVRLICEVVLVLTGALTLLYIGSTYLNGRGEWLLGPVILVTSALAPTRLRKIKVTEIGLNFKQISLAL